MKNKKNKPLKIILCILLIIAAVFVSLCIIYMANYYHVKGGAEEALNSDDVVKVSKTEYGYFFDGPSEDKALIFYQGAKVEERAYAPLLRKLAEEGIDVCLVDMPFDLAVMDSDKADEVMGMYDYDDWYIGGHSLGGCMAAYYASEHADKLDGVIMLASYPAKAIEDNLRCITIYGDKDGVIDMKRFEASKEYLPEAEETHIIPGGNHAQFGNYGHQVGDNEADISAEVQQEITVDLIMDFINQ